jgi:hypothetical protein
MSEAMSFRARFHNSSRVSAARARVFPLSTSTSREGLSLTRCRHALHHSRICMIITQQQNTLLIPRMTVSPTIFSI